MSVSRAVSYTHLDVYKRQILAPLALAIPCMFLLGSVHTSRVPLEPIRMRRQQIRMIWFGVSFVMVASLATVGIVAFMGGGVPL